MSSFNRSFALEEIKESEFKLEAYLPRQHLTHSNAGTDRPLPYKVVKVSGSITVSF